MSSNGIFGTPGGSIGLHFGDGSLFVGRDRFVVRRAPRRGEAGRADDEPGESLTGRSRRLSYEAVGRGLDSEAPACSHRH